MWLEECSHKGYRKCPAMEPDLKSSGHEFKNIKVSIPNIYLGQNIGWVAENAPAMLNVYLQGQANDQNNISYPFKICGNICKRILRSTKVTAKVKGHITISTLLVKGG